MSQALCGLAFLFVVAPAGATGAFVLKPVRATLSAAQPVASFNVVNTGAETTVVQLEAVGWSQRESRDVFQPTRDVLATPPIFKIPPGGTQVVRVGLRRQADQQGELTYRLFFQEVPPAPAAGFQGLKVVLRMSVPVFVVPAMPVGPQLHWTARRSPKGELELGMANGGTAHVQVASVQLSDASGGELARQDIAAYLLAGQQRTLVLKSAPPPGTKLQVFAKTDSGDVHAELVVDKH